MTVCFVVQYGALCLVAADTRLSIDVGGPEPARQDVGDLTVEDTLGNLMVVPYKCRKIRPVGRGWAATAGTLVTGTRMLDVLQAAQASEPELAVNALRTAAYAHPAQPGGTNGGAIDTAAVLGVVVADNGKGAWLAEFEPQSGYAVTGESDFYINWPRSLQDVYQPSIDMFFEALKSAEDIGGAVRAAAALIGAARFCPTCGPYVQIGFTVHESGETFRMGYVEGPVDELTEMSTDLIRSRIENPREWQK